MLRSIRQGNTHYFLPHSNMRYRIDTFGNISDRHTGEFVSQQKDFDGDAEVEIFWLGSVRKWKVLNLIAITFKNVKLPTHLLHRVEVLSIDGNRDNPDPRNLVVTYGKDGLPWELDASYRYIPEYSNYVINEQGRVRNILQWADAEKYLGKVGYYMVGMTSDLGKRTIVGVHRCLALAFKEYPADVDKLDVNHLNGVKTENDLPNIEWSSKSGNITHAYMTGLRSDNKFIHVTNIWTEETFKYYSSCECGRRLNISQQTAMNRTKLNKVYPPGLVFGKEATQLSNEEIATLRDEYIKDLEKRDLPINKVRFTGNGEVESL